MPKGKAPKNPLVGRWIPEDVQIIRDWALKQLEKLKTTENFKKWREVFPECNTMDQTLAEFMRNAHRMDEIGPKIGLHKSVSDLVKAMGTEPDVGMLIVQMNMQTPFENKGKYMDVPAFIFLLNSFLTLAPRFIEAESRKFDFPFLYAAKFLHFHLPLLFIFSHFSSYIIFSNTFFF